MFTYRQAPTAEEAAEAGAALREGLPALTSIAGALAAAIQQEHGLGTGAAGERGSDCENEAFGSCHSRTL